MNQFVFLFRKGPRKLSESEDQRRADEVKAWAGNQISEGRALDPRILGEESNRIYLDGESGPSSEWPLIAAIFLQARDFIEAVKIAQTHPGIRYGMSIEVRPWSLPVSAQSKPAQQ